MNERREVIIRIGVAIISGIILCLWFGLIKLVLGINWIYTLFSGKRHRGLAEFSEIWNTQFYIFSRYIIMLSNKRPFPFAPLEKNMSEFEE